MANASAKKAAAARASTSSIYFPILSIINIIYILLRVVWKYDTWDRFQIIMSLTLWSLTLFAYKGIMEDAANNASSSSSNKKLAGGASLDLLGLIVLVQFGSVLMGDGFFWLLVILPFWGGYKMYSTMKGLNPNSGDGDDGNDGGVSGKKKHDSEEDKELAARRQKRAEKRRQKRM